MKQAKNLNLERILSRGVEEIIEKGHLENSLKAGKKLRVKLGIDPTRPDIHLGHTVPLRKLRQFQEAGHKAILVIGDFTARIGDPSGQSAERKPLTDKEIKKNLKNYIAQAGKILDIKKTDIQYNSKWLGKLDSRKMAELLMLASVQQLLERNDFKERMAAGKSLRMNELLYPILQAYDSVIIKPDVEIGGTDQKFNLLAGRTLMEKMGLKPQDILTTPIIEGTDGVRKMSKSYDNYIAVNDSPTDMFGKIMAIPDSLIDKYFELLTDERRPDGFGPREAKLTLAETVVSSLHNQKKALTAKEEFVRVFSKREVPKEAPELKAANEETRILDLAAKALPQESKSELRRLIIAGAVRLGEQQFRDADAVCAPKKGEILKIGKHRFFKIS